MQYNEHQLAQLAATVAAGEKGPFLGFDRNVYPGDDALPILRKTAETGPLTTTSNPPKTSSAATSSSATT